MTTLETIPTRPYPPQIQQLRRSIKHAESVVKDLTAQLIAAQNECEQLQNEWLQYQASIAPVRKCPSEVLLMIFQIYLIEDPRIVCNLLFVCKHWYEVVSSSPLLWSRIRVDFTDDWDVESISESTNLYVDMCLQRSGSMMLDIQLDFSRLIPIWAQIRAEILGALQNFVSSEGHDTFLNWINGLDVDQLDDQWIMSSGHLDYAFQIIKRLSEESGMRWRSLELQLPKDNGWLARQVWEQFIYPAPNLTRMVVGNFHDYFSHQSDIDNCTFPGLSALKHLELHGLPSWQCFTTATSLESIVLHRGLADWNGRFLSSFKRLKSLELAQGDYPYYLNPSQCTISLPELRQLIVRGEFQYLRMIEFVVPKLQFLDIIQDVYRLNTTLPEVTPPHVRWGLEIDWLDGRKLPTLRPELDRILLRYPTAEHLTCPRFLKEHVTRYIQELKTNGTLSSALKTVSFKGEDDLLDVTETWHASEP